MPWEGGSTKRMSPETGLMIQGIAAGLQRHQTRFSCSLIVLITTPQAQALPGTA
jgi:hypothetical protein